MAESQTGADSSFIFPQTSLGPALGGASDDSVQLSPLVQYGMSLLFVALATAVAFGAEQLAGGRSLTLIYVLPVIAAATWLGWGPSLAATIASVLAFDYFFTDPRFTLEIDSPTDIWAAALLLVIAIIVSALAAQSRRREQAARRAAEQAGALQTLANVIVRSGSQDEIIAAAATALSRTFFAPSVIFEQRAGALRPVAHAGGAKITSAEAEAAAGAIDTGVHVRAETYPFVKSAYDFWPVMSPNDGRWVLGVGPNPKGYGRPKAPDQVIEIIGGYLAAGLRRPTPSA